MKIRRFSMLAFLGVLTLLSGRPLTGQWIGGVERGEQVMITYFSSSSRVVVGLLHDVQDDAFLVNPTGSRVVPVPRNQVTDFRVLRGQEREWKKGLYRGALVGAITGVLMITLLEEGIEGAFGGGEAESSPGALVYGAIGALYGGGIGAGIGLFFKKDRWEPVTFRSSTSNVRLVSQERFSFGVTIPLGQHEG